MKNGFRETLAIALSGILVLCPLLPASGQATQPPPAGEVKAYKAAGFLSRAGTTELEATLATPVLWQDRLKTEPGGRVRIGLLDGSILNVGSGSRLTVIQHNAQTRETQLDMTVGKLRCVVDKLEPGQKFEIKTPTAVLGVIGTDFLVIVTATETRVIVFQGVVKVTNISSAILGSQRIGMGRQGLVRSGRPPSAPEPAYRGDVLDSLRETEIGEKLPEPNLQDRPVEKAGLNKWVIIGIVAAVAAAAIAIPIAVSDSKSSSSSSSSSGGPPID